MQIQSNLGSDICMAFDECIENPAPRDYVQKSVDRTYRWLVRCKAENARLEQPAGYGEPPPDALGHQPGRHLSRYPH